MKKDYTIAVAGTGYVGLSIATLLSQHHKVMAVDIVKEKVDLINNRKSPIQDNYIQNIVKLINTIDFLKISSIDYYILFLACYLHDISMVKIPACDSFLLDTDKADELAKTLLDSYNEEFNKANLTKNVQGNDIDILSVKKYMLDRKYPASIEQYTGDILLVGINYDKKTKKHESVIEQYEK